jgi:hypothetical protein
LAQQLDPPLTATSPKVFAASLMRRMEADPELALDVVDYIVAHPDRLKDE